MSRRFERSVRRFHRKSLDLCTGDCRCHENSRHHGIVPAGCVRCVSGCVQIPCTVFLPIFCDKTEFVYGVYAIFLFFSFYYVYLLPLRYTLFIFIGNLPYTLYTTSQKFLFSVIFLCTALSFLLCTPLYTPCTISLS